MSAVDDHGVAEAYAKFKEHFFTSIPEDVLFGDFDSVVKSLPESLGSLASQFRYNLSAVSHSVAVPFLMLQNAHLIQKMEDFRRCYEDENAAAEAFNVWTMSPISSDKASDAIIRALLLHSQLVPELRDYSAELLRQGAVLLYAAFEMLIVDGYAIWTGKDTKPLAIARQLTGAEHASDALKQFGIWQLAQDRHVIAHRCGILDDEYVKNTGTAIPVGTRLIISPQALHDHFFTVVNCGRSLLELFGDPYDPHSVEHAP